MARLKSTAQSAALQLRGEAPRGLATLHGQCRERPLAGSAANSQSRP